MTNRAFTVQPLSRRRIREIADLVRKTFEVATAYIDIVRIVERELPKVDKGFFLDVAEKEELGDAHGLALPTQKVIRLREDVYERACDGQGRDRMTVAHELGHYILHRAPELAEIALTQDIPIFRTPEWQANTFAAELLISHQHVSDCVTPADFVGRFVVTYEAARVQWQVFDKEGLLTKTK